MAVLAHHLTALSGSHVLLLVAAGLGAGIFNGVAGGGSLISFPVLLALGYPALTANITNTVGIWPGYLGGAAGFRTEIKDQSPRLAQLSPVALAGGVLGAILLLTTPSSTFARLAPYLILAAAALFAAQPVLRRALTRSDSRSPGDVRVPLMLGGTFLAAVYGGYFGAGMGVVLLAVLGLALPDSLARTSGLRTALSIGINGVAAAVFLIHRGLAWEAVGWLALGSLLGGWVGAKLALSIPAWALRTIVILIGVGTAVKLLAF